MFLKVAEDATMEEEGMNWLSCCYPFGYHVLLFFLNVLVSKMRNTGDALHKKQPIS